MFSKKENFPINKLKLGYTFDLFRTNWKIIELGEYSWDMDNTCVEYTIESREKTAYVEIEYYKNKYEVIYSEAVSIDEAYLEDAIKNEEFYFQDTLYRLEETYSGNYKNPNTFTRRETLTSYMFYHKDSILTIELWDDGSYESYIGQEIKAKKIKNIKTQ